MTGITALLLFAAWTLALMFIYSGYRVVLVLTMKSRADAWGRARPDTDPPFIQRAHHAHLNCVENLPVFAAIVLAAHFLGKAPVVDAVAVWVLVLRLAQSLTHLAGVSHWHVFVRANFFILQALLYLYMIWGLLA
jgi:uncharacterized MAPEG superfamily protein